ncbi:SGNH/GDSL hydrolase family protein [Nonomuraea angiospora]|uniref:SGNH/GDSL hydrolase family protein n=1 Tax=Nonomuraea angiospora TaxID=46172 RepID=UPI00344F7CFD
MRHFRRIRSAFLASVLLVAGLAPPAVAGVPEAQATLEKGGTKVPQGDEIVFGDGDTSGYHVYAASSGDGWTWHALATLQPGRGQEERWIGQQCLTGDGRYAVVVVAPWSASNRETGVNAGGLVYAVDAHKGTVRPLASGASLAYFNPACGTGSEVALTSYLGRDQRPTLVTVLDAATGEPVRSSEVKEQVTSAVPVGDQIVAARSGELVDITKGRVERLAVFPGRIAELRPSDAGGVDLISHRADGLSTVWRWSRKGNRQVGTGRPVSIHLHPGRAGQTVVAGATSLERDSGLIAVPSAPATSLSGHATLPERRDTTRADLVVDKGVRMSHDLPSQYPPVVADLPARRLSQARTAATTDAPTCAVGRNDVFKQVWQPTFRQVLWAVSQAVQGTLTSEHPSAARPAHSEMYQRAPGVPLTVGYPSEDSPLYKGEPEVPPLVMYGILAQESNFSQASWHSPPGRSGNPLIANYYGTDSSASSIDYSQSDCGYGIAQITDGMRMTAGTSMPDDRQLRIAVDFASNIAASVHILQQKWGQLRSLGITMNNGDPSKVENWYAAIWGYNSGVHTDPSTRQGLGWFNNPANPIYPERHAFLHDGTTVTFDDARTPSHWPYQERVFGWIEVPQTANGELKYRGSYDWDTQKGSFLHTAPVTAFCRPEVNSCDADSHCPTLDSACWWNKPVTWAECVVVCVSSSAQQGTNGHVYYPDKDAREPAAPPQTSACAQLPSPGPNAIVVDDALLDSAKNPDRLTANLMGCDADLAALRSPASASATFRLLDRYDRDVLSTSSSTAAIDLHQIGGGAGGHAYFTHTASSRYADLEVRGQWEATLPADPAYGTVYEIKAFVPNVAAQTAHAIYEVSTGGEPGACAETGAVTCLSKIELRRKLDQSTRYNDWATLGYYLCGGTLDNQPGGPATCRMSVTLRSVTPDDDSTQGLDLAFDALAFVPVPTGGYVALGDSYSSGEGLVRQFDDGTNELHVNPNDQGNLCHRATYSSWPGELANLKNVHVVNLACSGSNLADVAGVPYWLNEKAEPFLGIDGLYTMHFLNGGPLTRERGEGDNWFRNVPNNANAGSAYYREPALQISLLRALRPKFVTVTVGGNDVGFADILNSCLHTPSCLEVYHAFDTPHDHIDRRIDSLRPLLKDAYDKIAEAAGGTAKVYVVTYPNVLGSGPPGEDPALTDCTGIGRNVRHWLRDKTIRMAQTIRAAAVDAKVHVIDLSALFAGHELCADAPYATAPNVWEALDTRLVDNWFHPNFDGYLAMTDALDAQIPD